MSIGLLRRAVIVAWLVNALAVAGLASAHSDDNYWDFEWGVQDRGTYKQDYEITEQVPGDANSAWALRVEAGGDKWNAVNITNPDMGFDKNGGVANYSPYGTCAEIGEWRNGIHYRDVGNGYAAVALTCRAGGGSPGGEHARSFQIVFDPDINWYTGQSSSGAASNEFDLGATGTHEFGHVVGGWTGNTAYGHYDKTVNASLCGDSVSDSLYHTMCNAARSGPGGGQRRTLEAHDLDVFIEAYN